MSDPLILTELEIRRLTGYKRPADQLRELHRQGFHRARIAMVTRDVILERAHYTAVCSGGQKANTPKVRMPMVRQARAA